MSERGWRRIRPGWSSVAARASSLLQRRRQGWKQLLKSHAGQVEAAPKPVSGPRYQEDVADVVAHQRAVLRSTKRLSFLWVGTAARDLDLG